MIDKRKTSEQFICSVLGIGYPPREQNSEKATWLANGIEFDFADTIDQSIEKTEQKNYCCIVICSDWIHQNDLTVLRQICSVPIVIMPSEYSISQRQQYAVWSALQYIHVVELSKCQDLDKYSIKHIFEEESFELKPLTIITVKDLSFCLESRSVEICGNEISLTAKEFDILSLLICNQRQVFTHEMIVNRIWKEEPDFYSRKIVTTHISNLRKKLKSASKTVDYIKSVHGVGYRFNVDG